MNVKFKILISISVLFLLFSCEDSPKENKINKSDSLVVLPDSSKKDIKEHKDTLLKVLKNNHVMTGYFLCDDIAVIDKKFKGIYLDFDNLNESWFFLYDYNKNQRLEIINDSISYEDGSDKFFMKGHSNDLKIELDGAFLIKPEQWSDLEAGNTIVFKGDVKYNGNILKDIDFVYFEGE